MEQQIKIGMPALAILIMALSVMIPVSVNAKSLSYVLQCRGGGGITARIFETGGVKIFGYRQAKVTANVRPLGSGECAWLDRPMNKKEYFPLTYGRSKMMPFGHIDIRSNVTRFSWRNSRRRPITTVLKAIQTNKLFFVHVKKKRFGKRWMFNIVRVGP